MKNLAIPTVHLGGSSADSLMEGLKDAATAVMIAHEALQNAGPNARDYYVQSPEAWTLAENQHRSRTEKIKSVYDDIVAIYEAVFEQFSEHEERRRTR